MKTVTKRRSAVSRIDWIVATSAEGIVRSVVDERGNDSSALWTTRLGIVGCASVMNVVSRRPAGDIHTSSEMSSVVYVGGVSNVVTVNSVFEHGCVQSEGVVVSYHLLHRTGSGICSIVM